uniref:Ionotropic glutamate receptor L-glutamate and glycine-binding domain-containing protein n=1 Tax=Anopheles maculatus TaxID=74869 RepID=A0A182T3K5_9DIPT
MNVHSKQLILVGADDVDSIMGAIVNVYANHRPNYFAANSRNIYIVVILSDIRYLSSKIAMLLFTYFSSINFVIVSPGVVEVQTPVLIAIDYEIKMVIVPHDLPMRQIFTDRFNAHLHPVVQVRDYSVSTEAPTGRYRIPPRYDWNVIRTILEHMRLRWKFDVYYSAPSLELIQWFNEQLDGGGIDIFIDKHFRANLHSISHVLPEMNGVCLVIPKTKKYELLQHLLTPLLSTAWITLIIALLVGSFVAYRYFKNGLLATLIFGVDLNAPDVSRTERTVLFASLVVFFILAEAYQAKLVSLISSCRYPPDPKTVDEFLQTDIMLYVGEATATVISYRPTFKGRVRNATDYWFSFDGEQDYGTLLPCPAAWDFYVNWINARYNRYGYNTRPQVHIVRETILSMPASYTFASKFLLYPRFKVYLSRIFESGLIGYWQTEQDRQRLFEQKLEFVENDIISFSDLEMVWTVLGIGTIIALVAFLMELSVFALQKHARTCWPTRTQRLFVKSQKKTQGFVKRSW